MVYSLDSYIVSQLSASSNRIGSHLSEGGRAQKAKDDLLACGFLDSAGKSVETRDIYKKVRKLTHAGFAHISQDSVSLLLDFSHGTPQILHWGKALGSVQSAEFYAKAAMEPVAHAELDDPMFNGI